MKKLLVTGIALLVFMSGCTRSPEPAPVDPSPSVFQPSVLPTAEPSSADPTPGQSNPPGDEEGSQNDPKPTKNPDPTSTPTSEEPPATKFLKRWGLSFPKVEEASIMSAGAKTCERLDNAPDNWETNNQFITAVKADMESAGFGEVSSATAASFALDASQNLCSVIS